MSALILLDVPEVLAVQVTASGDVAKTPLAPAYTNVLLPYAKLVMLSEVPDVLGVQI